MAGLNKLRDAVHAIVTSIVRDPDSVSVQMTRGEGKAALLVVTSKDDLGLVIGKQGRTVRALRILIQAAAKRMDNVISLDVIAESGQVSD